VVHPQKVVYFSYFLIFPVKHVVFPRPFHMHAALNFYDKLDPDKNANPDASADLTPKLVDVAIVFLELASRLEQHKKECLPECKGQ
jgi:hypothetical protein